MSVSSYDRDRWEDTVNPYAAPTAPLTAPGGEPNPRADWPRWVRFWLWGARTRREAVVWFWIGLVSGVVSLPFGVWPGFLLLVS
jgi:hypothetical protein